MSIRVLAVTAVPPERDAVAAGLPGAEVRAEVLAVGVGPAAAAARTALALATRGPYDLVVSMGIGGGFAPVAAAGATVVASAVIAADLGAQLPAHRTMATTTGSEGGGRLGGTVEPYAPGRTGAYDRPGGPGTPDAHRGPGAPGGPGGSDAAAASGTPGAGFASVAELGFGIDRHLPPADLAEAAAKALGAVFAPVLTVSTATGTAWRAAELLARHPGAAAEAMEGFGVAEAAAAHGVPMLEIRTISNAVGPRDRAAWRIPEALAALTDAFARLIPVLSRWDKAGTARTAGSMGETPKP